MEVALSVLRFLGQEQGRTYKFTFIIFFFFFFLMEEGISWRGCSWVKRIQNKDKSTSSQTQHSLSLDSPIQGCKHSIVILAHVQVKVIQNNILDSSFVKKNYKNFANILIYKAKQFMSTKNNLKKTLYILKDGASGAIEQVVVKRLFKTW